VSEFCTATLAEYLTDRERKPQRLELLIGTLRGLAYIHGFSIVHGDLKGLNILVNEAGTPKICDFGHSRFTSDPAQPITSDLSSKFHATTRYMSPELFADPKSRPTIFSDVWAFGCVALEILSQLRPYHIIKNEHRVTLAIKSGRSPSTKPEYPYAASCLSDTLWKLVVKCWDLEQHARPTAPALLSAIDELVEKGELDTSHRTPVQAAGEVGEELVEWPEGIEDLSEGLSAFERKKVSVQRLADVWV
ncbi:kinase-like protein, partial [Ceratobasidium sp. AG-I]